MLVLVISIPAYRLAQCFSNNIKRWIGIKKQMTVRRHSILRPRPNFATERRRKPLCLSEQMRADELFVRALNLPSAHLYDRRISERNCSTSSAYIDAREKRQINSGPRERGTLSGRGPLAGSHGSNSRSRVSRSAPRYTLHSLYRSGWISPGSQRFDLRILGSRFSKRELAIRKWSIFVGNWFFILEMSMSSSWVNENYIVETEVLTWATN